jgi:hypothetical protein
MHSSVVLGDKGLWKEEEWGTTRQMSVTQLRFKLNPKEHLGYFGLLQLLCSCNALKQLLTVNRIFSHRFLNSRSKDIQKILLWAISKAIFESLLSLLEVCRGSIWEDMLDKTCSDIVWLRREDCERYLHSSGREARSKPQQTSRRPRAPLGRVGTAVSFGANMTSIPFHGEVGMPQTLKINCVWPNDRSVAAARQK